MGWGKGKRFHGMGQGLPWDGAWGKVTVLGREKKHRRLHRDLPSNPHTLETQGSAEGEQRGTEQPRIIAAFPLQEGKAMGPCASMGQAWLWTVAMVTHCCCHLRPQGTQGLARGMCVQPESERKHTRMSVDSSKADQFQAPCFTSDTITQKPLQGGSRRAPQGGHADKLKFSLEKGHEATWKEN